MTVVAVEWHEYRAEEVYMRYLVNAKYGMESHSLRLSGGGVGGRGLLSFVRSLGPLERIVFGLHTLTLSCGFVCLELMLNGGDGGEVETLFPNFWLNLATEI